ncbi:natural resistance-associated macrophage protein-domain-containing protein [Zopfochytrium polystomum]|nr:natural resistance-associated macrophage protein-domain-containing protein [Zopfochytrium polystomum]
MCVDPLLLLYAHWRPLYGRYMDPGNWSTDINAGSKFGYSLLFIILFSNLMAIALQSLCVRLGVVTGHDLAELCRLKFHPVVNTILWILAEIAIAATDLAEVIGAAIALNLLFGLPLTYGVAITVADVLLILVGWREKYFRFYEILISVLIFGIGVCFVIIIAKLSPYWPSAFSGFIPSSVLISNNDALFASMGIVGATIMPHNLYLHSALVQFRSPYKEINAPRHVPTVFPQSVKKSMKASLRHLNTDSFVSLSYAFVVNSAILITAAAATLRDGTAIESVQDTYHLLDGSLGRFSAVIFAVGLFLSGQSATITGTLAGQAVMEGFLVAAAAKRPRKKRSIISRLVVFFRRNVWARRLITRGLAVLPALVCSASLGEDGINKLLNLSQVVLSLLLPFSVWPLVVFTSSKRVMTVKYCNCGAGSEEEGRACSAGAVLPEEVSYESSWPMTVVGVVIGLILTGLNLYLLIEGGVTL